MGRYLSSNSIPLRNLVLTLSKKYSSQQANSKSLNNSQAISAIRQWVSEHFPWAGLFRVSIASRVPAWLALSALARPDIRALFVKGLSDMLYLHLTQTDGLERQEIHPNPSRGPKSEQSTTALYQGASFPAKKPIGSSSTSPRWQPADGLSGQWTKDFGIEIGYQLANRYHQFAQELRKASHGGPTLYELIGDLEKDLKANAIRPFIPPEIWNTYAASGQLGAFVDEIRKVATDEFLLQISLIERREVATKRHEQRTGSSTRGRPAQDSAAATKAAPRKPSPVLHLNPDSFEAYCVEWSVFLGYADSRTTRSVKDGGFDVVSAKMIAQCKFQELPVGVKAIRELHGVATAEGKEALFFSVNGYSREALQEAVRFKIQLWIVRPLEGRIERAMDARSQMNEGDVHSGPEGYSPNTGYPDTFYGSGMEAEERP